MTTKCGCPPGKPDDAVLVKREFALRGSWTVKKMVPSRWGGLLGATPIEFTEINETESDWRYRLIWHWYRHGQAHAMWEWEEPKKTLERLKEECIAADRELRELRSKCCKGLFFTKRQIKRIDKWAK